MKTWLIHTRAPYYGTDQYYVAYSEENPSDRLARSELIFLWFNLDYF